MTQSIEDLNAYLSPILSAYPSLPSNAGVYIAKELSALQTRYFEEYAESYGEITSTLQTIAPVDLTQISVQPSGALCADRVRAAFYNGTPLPLVSPKEYEQRQHACCTLFGESLALKGVTARSPYTLKIIYALCPAKIGYSNSSFTGAIYLPERHLPLLQNKLFECVCRLAGEFEEADLYAKAFNACLEAFKPKEKPGDRLRAAL